VGSKALTFEPGRVRAGEFRFTIGTAGNGTLVLQTILPPLALAGMGSFSAVNLNMHAKTNMEVIRQFLPVSFQVTEVEGHNRVSVGSPDPYVR
jgi:RNA 3'-terminal phosphate cyclase